MDYQFVTRTTGGARLEKTSCCNCVGFYGRFRLNAAIVQALADPAVKKRFSDLGLDVATREQQSPEGLAAFHKGEIEKWWPVIKGANIRVE